jgi:hypothetical protein
MDVSLGNEQQVIDRLELVVTNEDAQVSCTICFVCLHATNDRVVYTCSTPQCKSFYCSKCLPRWMATKPNTCALCKNSNILLQTLTPSSTALTRECPNTKETHILWLCIWCTCVVRVLISMAVVIRLQTTLTKLETELAISRNIYYMLIYKITGKMYLCLACMYGIGILLILIGVASTHVHWKVLCVHDTCNILNFIVGLLIVFFIQYTGENEPMTVSAQLIAGMLISLFLDIRVLNAVRLLTRPT